MEQSEIIEGTKYYIISLKNTHKKDSAITFYRSKSAGYCWFQEWAGIYLKDEAEAIEDFEHTIKVSVAASNKFMIVIRYDGIDRVVLPNTADVRSGLKLPFKRFSAHLRSCYMAIPDSQSLPTQPLNK
jgi:hypothetical protein